MGLTKSFLTPGPRLFNIIINDVSETFDLLKFYGVSRLAKVKPSFRYCWLVVVVVNSCHFNLATCPLRGCCTPPLLVYRPVRNTFTILCPSFPIFAGFCWLSHILLYCFLPSPSPATIAICELEELETVLIISRNCFI